MPPKGMPTVSWEGQSDMLGLEKWWIYTEIIPEIVTPSSKDGQRWITQVKLPYDLSQSRLCIVAWVAGQYRIIEDRLLDPFTITGSTLQALSPEYDMKSQIEFRFSQDIYSDIGALYSREYIDHRHESKIAFLKSLSITPRIDISPDDVMLTPEQAILTLPLKEWEKYTFSLSSISDIYGRKSSLEYMTTLKSEPFLSLKLVGNKQIYRRDETIRAKLYTLLPPKNTYPLRLCRIDLETYTRLERILSDTSRANNIDLWSLLPTSSSDCREKDIVLTSWGYVSSFTVNDFLPPDATKTWLYVLSFARTEDTEKFERFISPLLFSIVDTHVTLKVDSSGKMMILTTDISTGLPLPDQEITVMRNISRTHTEKWDPVTGKTDKIYLPLTNQSFATGVVIGKTDARWYLDTKIDTLKGIDDYDSTPYWLAFDSWWDYEGRYDSFLVESRASGSLGYLVSTWNDGITGYNFGIKDSDYSWESRPEFTTYLHTDRRLYLPGEKVYIHGIIRKNNNNLMLPLEDTFDLVVNDPLGREVKRSTLKPNEFGSIGLEYDLPKSTPLGSYILSLTSTNSAESIQNGYSNFQVEVFKNPTFTATVELKSPDLENDMIKDLRKTNNTDPYNPWYNDVYNGNFTIEGIVKAKYYNGAEIKNTWFTYRVYRSDYFSSDYFSDCFWWCYYEPPLEQYTEGSGSIDSEGYGIFRIPVEYSSYYSDYKYTVEVTIRDALTGEEVTTPDSLIVKLPAMYKSFSPDNPLVFTPKKKILNPGETITGDVSPTYGKWDVSLVWKYRYEIIHREYIETYVDDIRSGHTRITTAKDQIIASGSILKKEFSYKLVGQKPWEYHLRIMPITSLSEVPDSSISDTIFYIAWDISSSRDNALRVISERTVYKLWEKARVIVQVPFTGSYLLITREKGWVIDREYTYLSGNTLTREYTIDDTMIPNAYIGVVALRPTVKDEKSRTYAVWYGEIVTDIADKKALLTLTPDKTTYKNRETVSVDLILTDRSWNPLEWEVTMMVVDESLIRLLGNIDLDVIPKFYQKYPFTVKTALSAIGIERNRFLSRKWSNWGWGNKWGWWVQISSRTLFQNTAYYNPSIRTDISGKAKVSFTLPDNITDYRIITIANTRDSKFAIAEKTIEVRKDYVLESAAPTILRSWDIFTITASAFNNTKRITPVEIVLTMGTWASKIEKKWSLTLDALGRKSLDFSLEVPSSWKENVSYTISLREKDKLLDSITHSIVLPSIPIVTQKIRSLVIFSGSTYSYTLPKSILTNVDDTLSQVDITASSTYATQIGQGITSLLQYPYGCIEQTISSTLPNRIALSLADTLRLPIDTIKARENTKTWLEKILRMQHFGGGWVYWEWSPEANAHITPYVLRSLLKFQELGETIPQEVFTNGINYIINNEWEYSANPDDYAEAVWTLATLKDTRALIWWSKIDPTRLSRHGYVAYAYAAQKLGKYTREIEKSLIQMLSKSDESWYWSIYADKALFAQLLLERWEREKALISIDALVRDLDLTSYYVSTQEKIQTLLALITFSKSQSQISDPIEIALRSERLIADITITPDRPANTITTNRANIWVSYTLKRNTTKIPLYITTYISDRPKDITTMAAYATWGITIERNFERIDESKWVDEKGGFIVRVPILDRVFQKWKLYKVTLRTTTSAWSSRNLSLEDFFPGGWRPINGIFHTEQSIARDTGSSWWSHVESREDRLLAHRDYLYQGENTLEYIYYIRPESLWEYLLPPATVYFMYRPEIHAYTKYERVRVVE
jgi:alpha-2-macroglobulin